MDWLLEELTALSEPIDLVGHDWGALIVMRSISLRPQIVRSWAAGAAPIDSEYKWHEAARLWQTPEIGEQVMESLTMEALQMALSAAGVPKEDATETTKNVDATMKQCILKLYRSAVNVGSEWENDLRNISSSGLILWGEADPYVSVDFGVRLANRTGARFVSFPGCSHWWQLQRPDEVVLELKSFWAATS